MDILGDVQTDGEDDTNIHCLHLISVYNLQVRALCEHVSQGICHTLTHGSLTLSKTSPCFYVSAVQVFRKHCGKRRNCMLRAVSPYPHCCLPCCISFLFSSNSKLSSVNSFSLEESKICCLEKHYYICVMHYTKQDIIILWINKIHFVKQLPEFCGRIPLYFDIQKILRYLKFQPMSA